MKRWFGVANDNRIGRRGGVVMQILYCLTAPAVILAASETIHRGWPLPAGGPRGHFFGFAAAYLLLLFLLVLLASATGRYAAATLLVSVTGCLPAAVSYYKLSFRGEPFLPWDLGQARELWDIRGGLTLRLPGRMVAVALLLALLCLLAWRGQRLWRRAGSLARRKTRALLAGASVGGLGLLALFFLTPEALAAVNLRPDGWSQSAFYERNGVLSGFLANVHAMGVETPPGYGEQAVRDAAGEIRRTEADPAVTAMKPDIVFLMGESVWDMTRLPGIAYDRELLPNLTALSREGGHGMVYSPSFGGGTCDVEFEALTGFSMAFLPAESKPFQQYATRDLETLPRHLKRQGYRTVALHGNSARFWSRDTAYPRLGFDRFLSDEDFVDPVWRRGYISDESTVDEIIRQLEGMTAADPPLFLHGVTIQNHQSYRRDSYPEAELVRVVEAPASVSAQIRGELEDSATGVWEMDQALGRLADYLRARERPTILVFWGDHVSPMSNGLALFEELGFTGSGEGPSNQYRTPLLIWDNFAYREEELGTIATFYLPSALLARYGMASTPYFDYLREQAAVLPYYEKGAPLPDRAGEPASAFRQRHALLQYDLLFGEGYLEQAGR